MTKNPNNIAFFAIRTKNKNCILVKGKVFESLVESKETTEAAINAGTSHTYEEHKLIDEILNCKNLQDVVSEHNECKHTNKSETSHRRTGELFTYIYI